MPLGWLPGYSARMIDPDKPLAAEDDRNRWIGAAIFLLGGGISALACAGIFLLGAFMDRNSDKEAWQLWLGMSAGLTLASVATGILVATIRRRTPKIWAIPAVLFAIPVVVMLVASTESKPLAPGPPPPDFPLNVVETDAG